VKERAHLVIDASVARAAGGEGAEHPTSRHCRDFLGAVLRICNHTVLTAAGLAEWKKHRSRFARLWLASMFAKRKVDAAGVGMDAALRGKILDTAASEKEREAMAKDLHLLDAALKTDRIVVSLDDEALGIFARTSGRVGEIREIVWINPAKAAEGVIEWLEGDTPAEEGRKLRDRKA
jgi:hypothetical protein